YEKSGRIGDPPEWRLELENGIPPLYLPVDVGPATVNRIKGLFEGARTILWNGPLGVWEIEPFGAATRAVALLIVERVSPRHQRSVLCGQPRARHSQLQPSGRTYPPSDDRRRAGSPTARGQPAARGIGA